VQERVLHRRHCQRRSRRRVALTLIELLMVIAILGALATGAVPSVRLLMAHANAQDVASRLRTSWQLAQAMAQAQQCPVVWNASADEKDLHLTIESAHGEVLWSTTLVAHDAQIVSGDTPQKDAHLVIYSHGLTGEVAVTWDADGKSQRVALGVLDEPTASSNAAE
jgi:prepilin-type N-terminal cleavage/methylation domain-containing protein